MNGLSQMYLLVDQRIAALASDLAGAEVDIEKSATWGRDDHSDYLDFDKPDVTARLTFWTAGMAEMEALDLHTGARLWFLETPNLDAQTLDDWLKRLIAQR